MPVVKTKGGKMKKFPYTEKGKEMAKSYSKKMKAKKKGMK